MNVAKLFGQDNDDLYQNFETIIMPAVAPMQNNGGS